MMQNNIKIAITGGIGSGKSEVCRIISKKNFPVFSCDEIYKQLCTNKDLLQKLQSEFEGIVFPDGSLNRTALSRIVFNDKEKLKKLNAITHPEIFKHAFGEMQKHSLSFIEIPLLFESGYEELFDAVLVILRNKEHRLDSIIKRNHISMKDALLRINNQIDYDNTNFTKYYVIHNNGNLLELEKSVLRFLEEIKMLYKNI